MIYPVLMMILASLIATILGISINEGGTTHYYIKNWDVGQTLCAMFSMGWLTIITVPVGLVICAISAIAYIY